MAWLAYYNELQKDIALKVCGATPIEYGDVVYESPEIQNNTRWLVTIFRGEYNVFVDHISCNGKCDRNLGASFCNKEKAVAFALEMFLVSSGRLRRKHRYCLNSLSSELYYE